MCSKSLDNEISSSKNYNMLDISSLLSHSSQILCLPEKIAQLPNELSELEISNNEFTEFAELLCLVKNLKKLQIQNNVLKTLPTEIKNLQNLHTLNLSNNQLEELPNDICDLRNLEILNLSHNKLTSLPSSYDKLQKLKHLDISYNNFSIIPRCVASGMGTLKVFNISSNCKIKMNIIPYSKYLEKFHARENGNCHKFPDWTLTAKFFNLKDINLDKTTFDIYTFIGKEGNLNVSTLSMTSSNISSPVLEMMIENMGNLEKINFSNDRDYSRNSENVFNNIPISALKNPELITEMNFRGTSLATVPVAIKQLHNLKKLDIGLNCIFWLPDEFCFLEKLEFLAIDENSLFMLPENIGNLKSLQELEVQNNALVKLPKTFKNLRNLKFADFYDNKFKEFPDVLSEMINLQGLDVDQNFFPTDSIKIGHMSYSALRCFYLTHAKKNTENHTIFDSRANGMKEQTSVRSDVTNPDYNGYSSSNDENYKVIETLNDEPDDDWDVVTNSDDDFDPEDNKNKYDKGKPKGYVYQEPQGFCPADWHLQKVRAEVISMRAYGSLPSFKIEEGQFDDAV